MKATETEGKPSQTEQSGADLNVMPIEHSDTFENARIPPAIRPSLTLLPPIALQQIEMAPTYDSDRYRRDSLPISLLSPTETRSVTEVEFEPDEIIHGVVVVPQSTRKKKVYIEWMLCLITTIVIFVVIANLLKPRPREDVFGVLNQPSPSPTASLEPSWSYEDYLKDLFVSISSKEVLDDPNSRQRLCTKIIAKNLPVLIENNLENFNDTEKLIERYAICVLMISSRDDMESFKGTVMNHIFGNFCDIFICNDKGQVSVFQIINQHYKRRGTIATEIGALQGLTDIILLNNEMDGTIPTEIAKLEHLQRLELRNNEFNGTIPTEIGQLQNLEIMLLGSNQLEKQIPSQIQNMTALAYMDFSQNLLTGTIPTGIGEMKSIKGFCLVGNNFSGSLEHLCDHKFGNKTSFSKEFKVTVSTTHLYTADGGVMVDCVENNPVLECSCCQCHP